MHACLARLPEYTERPIGRVWLRIDRVGISKENNMKKLMIIMFCPSPANPRNGFGSGHAE
jgi:hypothetical protein